MTEREAGRYLHPLADRYASREMQSVFSPERRIGVWRRLWLALAESQRELGLAISPEALEEMRAGLDDIDLSKAAEYERRFRHDVMAHVHLFGDVAPSARPILHLGATSAYVGDNADLILHREALTLVRARAVRTIRALASFAKEHRALPTLGYTHFQPAQPTTVGKRATLWIQDLLLDIEEIDFRLAMLRFRGVRGTTGTQASFLELFHGSHEKVEALERLVSERMGFTQSYGASGQTYPRKVDAGIAGTLAGTAISLSKFGHDLRLLAHLREVEEPFEEEQIGSSAMPYKRNPMRAERICALARHVISLYQDPATTAATQWLERTLDDSANRRLSIPDAFLTLDGALVLAENVAGGLRVHSEVVRKNLREELPFMATEALLMRGVEGGGDRQDLHERIRQHAFAAAERIKGGGESDLVERLSGDDAFGMDRRALEELLEPARFVGRAPEQVDHFLESWVAPVLARLTDEADSLLGVPDVRV
ncbi:MAG: adenylosuccinate lyase [Gemmatimonadota bacterium]